jgi:exonuclease SbcD
MYRILHTADWHLGKMLGDFSREEEHAAFLDFLLETIRTNDIDALLIAGDIFDSANPPQSAVAMYYNFLSQLQRIRECQVIVIAGNHDSPSHIDAPKQLLKHLNTHVVGHLPENIEELLIALPNQENPQVIVAAVPFLRDRDLRTGQSGQSSADIQAVMTQSIADCYRRTVNAVITDKNVPIIAMGHLTVAGSSASDSEREIHIGGLGALTADRFPSEFCYVALGHLHRPQRCGKQDHIRYSGSPIPLSFSEATDKKELVLLEIDATGELKRISIPITPSRQLLVVESSSNEIESILAELAKNPSPNPLPLWVEINIINPTPGENIAAKISSLTEKTYYKVIRIVAKKTSPLPSLSTDLMIEHQQIDELLSRPSDIFDMRVAQELGISVEQQISLKQTFARLLTIHQGE